jgi:hypothetical protein
MKAYKNRQPKKDSHDDNVENFRRHENSVYSHTWVNDAISDVHSDVG